MTTSDRNETVVNGYLPHFHSAQIEKLPAGDDPYQPLHARAFASVERSGGVKTLSRQFYELLADAGLTMTKVHRRSETARVATAHVNYRQFHFTACGTPPHR